MPSFTVRIGLLLVVLGTASYVLTGGVSLTALIPAAFGLLLAICGMVALRRPAARPHAMHLAALLALLGLLGTASALFQLPALWSGTAPPRPAFVARASMAVMLLVYLGFSVKSFVDARLRRKA
jgi:peptidoglycan/LPS O-acetylase OafA/YrhL